MTRFWRVVWICTFMLGAVAWFALPGDGPLTVGTLLLLGVFFVITAAPKEDGNG